MKYIGAETVALKSRKLVAGRGQYAGDVYLDNMLYLAFARSLHAHAKISRIDTAAASAVDGVIKVLTPDETRDVLAPMDPGVPEGVKRATLHALPIDKVRYVGEPVAAVAALDKYAARKAADLIEIEYDDLPAVVDCEAALSPESPCVQSEWNDNLMGALEYRAGDPDRAFAEADGVVSGMVKSHRYLGTAIEPRAYVANFDPFQRMLTVWASTQHPHQFRTFLAATLRLPENSVRVIENDVGGAFGLKMPFYADEAVIAYLAMALQRPVKWVEERNESFLAGGHAREKRFQYEAAYKKDGRVVGLRIRALADVGAPAALHGWAMAMVCASTIPTAYKIPNCDISMKAVATNKSPWAAYRGFGKENANFLMERIMDRVADAAGLDRAEVRIRNYIQPEEFPYHQASGSIIDSGDYPAALQKVLAMIGYDDFPRIQAEARRDSRRIGIGLSHELTPEGGTSPGALVSGYDGCAVRVTPSGDIKVLSGVTSPGTGNETAIAQIVADALGAELSRVSVVQGDTEICPFGLGNYSSRSVLIGGVAAHQAAAAIRDKMFRIASRMLEVMPSDLDAEGGRIFIKDAPNRGVMLADVAREVYRNSYGPNALDFGPGLEATRYFRHENVYHQPALHPFGQVSMYPSWPNGAAACIVEIDPYTGLMKILRYCYVHDSGRIVNPMLAEGNLHGAIAQGIGGAVYERLAYDDAGQLKTTTFYDYTIPTAVDLPTFEIGHQETLAPFNPLGLKGVGESGISAPLNALCGAVENAFPELRLNLDEIPLTPDRIWSAIRRAQGEK